ncbi:MAG: hypothetical protein WCG78_01865 [Candidatus Omnitrophota bacterium]
MRKIWIMVVITAVVCSAATGWARTATQDDVARELADRMDLAIKSDTVEMKDVFSKLKQYGVEPSGGWVSGAELTVTSLKEVLHQAARLGGQRLEERGIVVPQQEGKVDESTLTKVLNDPATRQALSARSAAQSGPSVPFPQFTGDSQTEDKRIVTTTEEPLTTPAPVTLPEETPPPTDTLPPPSTTPPPPSTTPPPPSTTPPPPSPS